MSELERLLALQHLDTAIDQLVHRRATLPARAEIAGVDTQLAALDVREEPVLVSRHSLERDQKRLEDEVRSVEDRRDLENARLYGGSVTAVKELQALQEELAGLGRRQEHLEDQIIELMESDEPLRAEQEAIDAERGKLAAQRDDFRAALGAAEAEIDSEMADLNDRRAAAAAEVSAELVERYEKLRSQLGGIAVARLVGTSCDGCHLTLPAVEVDKLRHSDPDEVALCFECGRILVH
ncbi:MAG: C4-type zinc ribbon domain-containing protein [Acidimicrobiales bacterium]